MRDREHGLFVPANDTPALALAVAALDDDRAGLFRMAEAARRRALEHYTVARLADDFRKLYWGCLAWNMQAIRCSGLNGLDSPRKTRYGCQLISA